MELIKSLTNEKIKRLSKLQDKKTRYLENAFLVEGYHLVEEANKLGLLKTIISTHINVLNQYDCEKIFVDEVIIKKLSTTQNPQNILGVVRMFEKPFSNINKYILLDGVNDPGNLGTIIRTSLALGINNIYMCNNTVDLYNEKVIRATQGAIFKANIKRTSLEEAFKELREKDIKIVSSSLDTNIYLNNLPTVKNFCLVVGNEANGISDYSKEHADFLVKIPMENDMESLNVAIASAILLYKLNN